MWLCEGNFCRWVDLIWKLCSSQMFRGTKVTSPLMSISSISKSSSYRTGGRTLFIDFQQNGVVKSLRDSKGNCASCISESENRKREISPSQSEEPWNIGKISYLFLSQPIATSVLADLVTLLVPARGTVSAVVFPLASRTFSATLSLLLRWLLVGVCVLAPGEKADISRWPQKLPTWSTSPRPPSRTCWGVRCASSSQGSQNHCQRGRLEA